MSATLRKCGHLLGAGQGRRWGGLVLLALLASGFEMVGALLIAGLLGLVANPETSLELPVLGPVDRFLGPGLGPESLPVLALVLGVFFVVRAGVMIGQTYCEQRVANNAGARLAIRLQRGYLALPYSFHLRRNSSDLIRNSTQAVQMVVRELLAPLVTLVANVMLVSALLFVLLLTSPLATVSAVAVLGPLVMLLLRYVQPRLKALGVVTQRTYGESIKAMQQSLGGVRDIRLLGREQYFGDVFSAAQRRWARAEYLRLTMVQIPRTMIETVLLLFVLGLFAVTTMTGGSAQEAVPVIGLFAYIGLRLQPSLQKVVNALNSIRFATPAIDDLYADLMLIESAGQQDRGVLRAPFRQELRLEDVSFDYEGADSPALRDVTLTIAPGESIGVCGPTGGGKSTLIDVMVGLLPPTSGRVTVDGVNIAENLRAWQRQIGMVPQSVFLIDDTLRSNIAFGIPEEEIDDLALEEAVIMAQLRSFTATLPQGLDTVIGERGVRLSGGQRQRVAIARALYRRPAVLIFDEGTSALDNTTESDLIEAIERLRGSRTIITVAHRLTTVRRCDRILFLWNGGIAASGTYEELVQTHKDFRQMVAAQ